MGSGCENVEDVDLDGVFGVNFSNVFMWTSAGAEMYVERSDLCLSVFLNCAHAT